MGTTFSLAVLRLVNFSIFNAVLAVWKDGILVKVRRFRRKKYNVFFRIAVQRDESHYVVGRVSNGPKPESLQPQASKK